jgi:soluble lytic murein transglycosylase-like protein
MLRTFKMCACVLVGLILSFYSPSTSIAEAPTPPVPIKQPTVQELVSKYAMINGLSPEKLLLIAKCESGFNQKAIGDHGLAIGIFQFHQQTWDSFSQKMGEELDIHSANDQAKLASWAFKNGLQSHWTCSKITHYVK